MKDFLRYFEPDALIEYGDCDCGTRTHASWREGEGTVFICDECREYFKGGFNVWIEENLDTSIDKAVPTC